MLQNPERFIKATSGLNKPSPFPSSASQQMKSYYTTMAGAVQSDNGAARAFVYFKTKPRRKGAYRDEF